MELEEYNVKRNKLTLLCWGIIIIVLIVAYFIEVLKGNRTTLYFIEYFLILAVPYVCSFIFMRSCNYRELGIRYVISLFYLVFYAFTMLTTVSQMSFIYIFPIISILIIYMDKRLLVIDYSVALLINIVSIVMQVKSRNITKVSIIIFEQQIACIILCALFLYLTCDVLKFGHNYMIKLSNEVDTDILTSAKNRHYLKGLIEDSFTSKDVNISLAVVDIDNFKSFNDTYGHNFGDLVLRKVSKVLIKSTNEIDSCDIIRTGGDEFLIFAKNMNEIELYNLCLKICDSISNLVLKYNEEIVHVNISIGVSNTLDDSCYSYKDLYDEADAQLYVAKHNGKNSVVHKERLGLVKG